MTSKELISLFALGIAVGIIAALIGMFFEAQTKRPQPVALSLKISMERRIIGLTEGFDELRNADTGCAERILARQNGVAEQKRALFRQVTFRAEAEKWIERHRWLTEQREPANGDYPEATNRC